MLKKLLLIIFIPILLTGCTRVPVQEISFASWGSITEVGILNKLISDFEQENSNVKVNFIHIPQNYFQKIHLLFASNTPPDVIFINNLYLPLYEKYLEDLSDKIKAEHFYRVSVAGLSRNGKLLAAPRDISELVFYVNLDKSKLPDSDWRLEELLSVKKSEGEFVVSHENDIYWLTPYLAYFGGGIYDKELNLNIDSQESQRAISFYRDLEQKYKIAPSKSQVGSLTQAQMFLDGKIVFYLSGRWMFPKISENAEFNWAVINFPYGETPQLIDASGWAVSKMSKNKDLAMKFVEYLSGEKSSEYFTKTGLIVPARIEASQLFDKNNHNEKIFIDVINHSLNTTVGKDYKKITDKINSELDL